VETIHASQSAITAARHSQREPVRMAGLGAIVHPRRRRQAVPPLDPGGAAHLTESGRGVGMAELRSVKKHADNGARNRRRVVTVIGSGTTADRHAHEVGNLIATMGFDLLTGAGRGVMEAVSQAFFEVSPRRGLVIGVVPAAVVPLEAVEARQSHPVEYNAPP